MIEFILNTKIISGNNALLELDLSKSKRISIFTDNNMLKIVPYFKFPSKRLSNSIS